MDAPGAGPEPEPPLLRRPQTLGGVVYLGVLAATGVGLVIVLLGAWRTGVTWIGGGLLVASATRLVLNDHAAGMLRVRRRLIDAAMLAAGGAMMIFLALNIPDQLG